MVARTWIAVILSCLIWFGYLKFFAPQPVPPQAGNVAAQHQPAQQSNSPSTAALSSTPTAVTGKSLPVAIAHRVENGKVRLGFSKVGGRIGEASLLLFHKEIDKNSPHISLIDTETTGKSTGAFFTDSELSSFSDSSYESQPQSNGISFSRSSNGVEVSKSFVLSSDSYFVDHTIRIKVPQGSRENWGHILIPIGARAESVEPTSPLASWEAVYFQNEKVERVPVVELNEGETVKQGTTNWVAYGNRYFAKALINQAELNPDVILSKQQNDVGVYLRYPIVLKAGQSEVEVKLRLFIGPKEYNTLALVPGLHELINYGFFSVFAFPLLRLLQFFYKFVHNYGIAILLLTVVVRILFYPLSAKGARSMKAMQKLQPQIQVLKERYKEDVQRFNQEQMALFKAHKVNPLGGCFPLLVQIPVFIALYSVLDNSIELFHAPFFGWIKDLSAKDPYYIFPILMGISMFVQQKMTPMAGMDPIQQKMMLMMPIVFTFLMVNLPSGLTAYIFLSTLLGILQQWLINRENTGTPVPVNV